MSLVEEKALRAKRTRTKAELQGDPPLKLSSFAINNSSSNSSTVGKIEIGSAGEPIDWISPHQTVPQLASPMVAQIPMTMNHHSTANDYLQQSIPNTCLPMDTHSTPELSLADNCDVSQCMEAGDTHATGSSNGGMLNGDTNSSPGSSSTSNAENNSTSNCGDAEGVWSADIDQAFQEALAIYPACGRRKIILSEEGKMYGRNELIARYIKLRCGKTRTRKQVSSHIQVLARKKQRELKAKEAATSMPRGVDGDFNGRIGTEMGASSAAVIGCINGKSSQKAAENALTAHNLAITSTGLASNFNPAFIANGTKTKGRGGGERGMEAAVAAAGLLNAIGGSMQAAIGAGAHHISNGIGGLANVASSTGMWQQQCVADPNGSALLGGYHNSSNRAELGDSEQFYQKFAAAALAAGAVPFPSPLLASTSPPSVLPLVPTSMLGRCYTVGKPPDEEQRLAAERLDYTIASSKLTLCEFTAYVEGYPLGNTANRVDLVRIPRTLDEPMETIKLQDIEGKYPKVLQELFARGPSDAFFLAKCWANMAFKLADPNATLYAVDSYYESAHRFDVNVATKACSFGLQVVEKVEVYSPIREGDDSSLASANGGPLCKRELGNSPMAADNNGGTAPRFSFKLEKSPMCDYMTKFISELKKLETQEVMNSVLDNFSVLQVITDKASDETLMVIAFMFEVSPEAESSCRVYRLVR